jgi:predicted lysophospholipase L1 biosynthesis ABC-type transport system permease subunit
VGAYTTGEVNLSAGERPLRVRSASVDDRLLAALGIQPMAGRLFASGETDVVPPPNAAGPVPPPPFCILSYELWQAAFGTLYVVLRTTLPPASLRTQIEALVREADSSVPIVRLRDMNGVFDESIRRPRLLAQLLGGFADLALLLAAIGTYGVLSYMVAQRRREIGIRMALGANQGRVLAEVLKQGLVLTTVGIVAGLAGAFVLNRLIASLLFGVQPTDPPTMMGVAAMIALVAAVACSVPARRAARVDPSVVLRNE